MSQGLQLVAPLGFRQLVAGRRYFLLHRDHRNARVVLAHFEEKNRTAHLTYLEPERYGYGKSEGLIQVVGPSDIARLPPWLSDRAGEPFDDSPKVHSKELAEGSLPEWHLVAEREEAIQEAADNYETIFSEMDPLAELNRLARLKGKQEGRFRRWIITYLAFGKNRWVLLPASGGRGKYDREVLAEEGRKTGRTGRDGPGHGCGTTAASKELMKSGFKSRAKKGMTLADVHADVLVDFYKVKCDQIGDRTEIVQLDPHLPFPPTYGQFRHWVIKLLTHEVVWTTLLGDQLYRSRFAAPVGSYAETLRDLLERVMSDAAAGAELPKSYLRDGPSLPLYQVESVDVLSGLGIGIAFGVGSERESLYAQCAASIALPKSLLGRVFNLEISDDEYPVSGMMPLASQTDQGKGAAKRLVELNKKFGVSPERSSSYTPQSQGPVEAGHANRETPTGGAPTHKVSSLTAFEMARDRLREFMGRNRSKSILNRLVPELVAMGIQTPIELWKHFLSEGRITGTPVKPVDVITSYLPHVTFEMSGGHLTHDGVVYRPARVIGDTDRVLSRQEIAEISREMGLQKSKQFRGYRFEISNLVEWVVIGRRLIEVHAIPRSAEHLPRTAMTAAESAKHAQLARDNAATSKELQTAERVRKRVDAIGQTGKKFMQTTVKSGRPRARTAAAKAEAAALKED